VDFGLFTIYIGRLIENLKPFLISPSVICPQKLLSQDNAGKDIPHRFCTAPLN
jgi:hypothetical protein